MSSLKDQLPNRGLVGHELKEIALKEFAAMLAHDYAFVPTIGYAQAAFSIQAVFKLPFPHEPHVLKSRVVPVILKSGLTGANLRDRAIHEFSGMMANDYIFQGSTAFRGATITMTATFHVGEPYEVKGEMALGEIRGEAPLNPVPAESSVIGLERVVVLENPNLDRINHDMPIIVQRASAPQLMVPDNLIPGELPAISMGAVVIENQEFRYDKSQFPSATAPVDRDVSDTAAMKLGVPKSTGHGLSRKV